MISTLAFPEYSPLPTAFVLTLLKLDAVSFLERSRRGDQEFRALLADFEMRLTEERHRMYGLMSQAIKDNEMKISWFRSQVLKDINASVSLPANNETEEIGKENDAISRQTILRWREKNWLPPIETSIRTAHFTDHFAALLIALSLRRSSKLDIGNLPPLQEGEPFYYCYQLKTPTDSWLPCPIPLPRDIAKSTLLWMPHQTFDHAWRVSETGSIRWAEIDDNGRWTLSTKDLKRWNPSLAKVNAGLLDLPGMGTEARHHFAEGTLLTLPHSTDRLFSFPVPSRMNEEFKDEHT